MSYPTRVRAAVVALLSLAIASKDGGAQILVTSPTVVERVARVGEEYAGAIDIRNTSAEPQRVSVRLVDYSFQANGVNRYDTPGTQPRSNAAWLTLAARTVEIPPRQQTTLRYVVRVPASDTLHGSYSSMVMVTAAPRDERAASATRGRTSAGVQSRLSFGVQVATHVSGVAATRFAMENLTIARSPAGERVLSVTVRNTGERALRPLLSLELYQQGGQLVASRKTQRGLIYPGSSVHQEFVLKGVPPGAYRALIQADAGEDDVFALQSDVKF